MNLALLIYKLIKFSKLVPYSAKSNSRRWNKLWMNLNELK